MYIYAYIYTHIYIVSICKHVSVYETALVTTKHLSGSQRGHAGVPRTFLHLTI